MNSGKFDFLQQYHIVNTNDIEKYFARDYGIHRVRELLAGRELLFVTPFLINIIFIYLSIVKRIVFRLLKAKSVLL